MFLSNKIRLILFLMKLYDNETFPFVNHAFATISISRLPPYLNLIFAIQVSLFTIFVKHTFLTVIQYKLDKESLVFKFTKTF